MICRKKLQLQLLAIWIALLSHPWIRSLHSSMTRKRPFCWSVFISVFPSQQIMVNYWNGSMRSQKHPISERLFVQSTKRISSPFIHFPLCILEFNAMLLTFYRLFEQSIHFNHCLIHWVASHYLPRMCQIVALLDVQLSLPIVHFPAG